MSRRGGRKCRGWMSRRFVDVSQPSSIDRLPDALREQLNAYLRDPSVTQKRAVALINQAIADEFGDEVAPLSKSSVNRYAQRMERVGAQIRQAREVADVWIGKLGGQPAGEVGNLINELVRTMALETAMSYAEGEKKVPPKVIQQLALAVQRLEQAATFNAKRERDLLADAGERAEETVMRQGLSGEVAAAIRAAIQGED